MKLTKNKTKQSGLNVPVFLLFFFACFIFVLNRAVVAQVPILEYKFNETGTTAYSTGSNASALTLRTVAGTVADFHSADRGGITGSSGDRALDNTSASYMGSNDGYKANQTDLDAIDTFMSFTLCGWFKTAGTEQIKYACLFENGTSSGFNLYGDASGTLKLKVDGAGATSVVSYTDTLTWVFFAVTYDGTDPNTSVVKFYKGTKTQPVAQVGTDVTTITFRGQVNSEDVGLTISNDASIYYDDAFDGYLDNLRIFGSVLNASGVLTQSQLEGIRAADVSSSGNFFLLFE